MWSIMQRNSESLQRYLSRFTEEANMVSDYTDNDAIIALIDGLKMGKFLKSLVGKRPTTMTELMTRAAEHISIEEYLEGRKASDELMKGRRRPRGRR